MNARERVTRTIEFGSPDRVPLWPRVEGTAWIRHGRALRDLLAKYPFDLGGLPRAVPRFDDQPMTWTDDWGCTWRRAKRGWYGEAYEHPLADREKMGSYEFPDYSRPECDARFAWVTKKPASHDRTHYALAGGATEYGVLWYRMWWLRGMANALEDTAADDGFVQELLGRILDTRLSYLRRVLEADVDGVTFGDCWGGQHALMISPVRWRELFKPAYKRLFDAVHEAGKHVFMQTDGCTTAILDDWMEIGVDVLCVQLNVVGLENVAPYRGKMCFYSDPDRQDILPKGSPQQVAEHIRDVVGALKAPDGGLIGSISITEGEPLANVEAALDEFMEYGAY
jgi:uroporphyrinogen decarboxylase